MPSDYVRICKDNIKRRGEEFDDIGRLISEQLYSDRAHFIYELLQNAEDALDRRKQNIPESKLPTNVKFLLYKDHLEFRHFGEKFNTNNVKGISDILKGTKSEDKTQIGKFGIGFKSVYAFTSTPEIHSGDEHFIIERYIRPRSADMIPKIADGETVFVFPFNHKDLSKEQAFQLIGKRLKTIGSRVLLFLKNISEIEWKIEGQEEGQYLKESKQHGRLAQKVTVIGPHGSEDEEEWFVFRRHLVDTNSSSESVVEVAFRLKDDGESKKQIIQKTESSQLVVYFPTKLETRFGFLVQGPYDTTASRSDVEDNEWNKKLIKATAFLVTEQVLPTLKEMGLFTASLLEALPIRMDDFTEDNMFYPIVEAIHNALLDQELLPADDGTSVSARDAKLASAEWLRTLLQDEQLRQLFNAKTHLKWISGEITERTKHDLWKYIREDLKVEEITPDSFVRKIEGSFLEKQTDAWMIAFYTQLIGQKALWKGSNFSWDNAGPLRAKQFIRLQDDSHVIPFKDDYLPNVYLPPENETEISVVKREITKDEKALAFLKDLGLTEPDAVAEIIERIIPKYTQNNHSISDDEHMRDMKNILHAYSTDSQEKKERLVEKLKRAAFVRAENLVLKKIQYKEPGQLYFRNEDLFLYFKGNNDSWFICSEYEACFKDLLENLGVDNMVSVKRESSGWKRYVVIEDSRGWHKRGLNGFDPGIEVDGLEYALTYPTIEKSLFIWNRIAIANADCICGKVESSRQQTYENRNVSDKVSDLFGRLLIKYPWLPDKRGNFHIPGELKLNDLPECFEYDERLANLLGMKNDVAAKLAEEVGISKEVLARAKEIEEASPETRQQIDSLLQKQKEKPEFPTRVSANSGRRQEQPEEQINEISGKQSQDLTITQPETEPVDSDCLSRFEQAFNRPGKTEIDEQIIDDGKVRNPDRRRKKSYEARLERVQDEPSASERCKETIRSILEGADPQVREYLYKWYGGRCQICDKTFPERDGKAFFVANYIIPRKVSRAVDTPANALSLCAEHFSKWQHGAVEAKNIMEQIESFKKKAEEGEGSPELVIKLCGEKCKIRFKGKHFFDLQGEIGKAPDLQE